MHLSYTTKDSDDVPIGEQGNIYREKSNRRMRQRDRERQRQERNTYREKSTIIKDFEKEIKKGEKHNIYKDISYRIMRKIDTWRKKSEETKRDMINRRG